MGKGQIETDYKGASVKVGLGHFYIDPTKVTDLVDAFAKFLAEQTSQLDADSALTRQQTDIDERLFYVDLTVKAKVA